MIDLNTIEKVLIRDNYEFNNWLGDTLSYSGTDGMGFDIETNGEDFPKTQLAGFSLYSKRLNRACYIPINHAWDQVDYNLLVMEIREVVQKVFDKCIMITHGGAYDFILMNKLGFKFYNAIDSMLLALALQFQTLGLKDLVLEFGLAKFNEIITYVKLMEKLGFPEKHVDFTQVDISQSKEAFDYAINDSIFTFHLTELLYNKYLQYIGTTAAGMNHKAQTDTMLLLCESSAKGDYIDQDFLKDFINTYGEELGGLEYRLMQQVRKEMGWV